MALAKIVLAPDGSLGACEGTPEWLVCLVRDLDDVARRLPPWPERIFNRNGNAVREDARLALDELRELVQKYGQVYTFGLDPLSDGALMAFETATPEAFARIVPAELSPRLRRACFRQVAATFALDSISDAIAGSGSRFADATTSRALARAASFMLVAGGALFRCAADELEARGRQAARGGRLRRDGSSAVKQKVLAAYEERRSSWASKADAAEKLAIEALAWAAEHGWRLTGSRADQPAKMRDRIRRWLAGL